VAPVGEESLGVRSMCLYVETRDVRILFDAGVSLAPRRFGLPPHPRELERARVRGSWKGPGRCGPQFCGSPRRRTW